MWIGVLGPVEVSRDGQPVALGGPKQRAVLAHLVVRANQVVPAETLIDLVWGDDPPEAARNSLQSYVSHLRKALGAERLEGRSPGYVLHVSLDELDAARFEGLLAEAADGGDTDRVAAILREGLGLWRGPAFADLAGEPGLAGEIARLDELRVRAVELRVEADLTAGRHGDVIGELEVLTREHPLRERLWASLMLGLYRSGRQADALAAFGRARETLADELGVDPSAELRALHERILRQDPELDIPGEPLRGYRLLEQVGEGAFGVVHRAIQPHVGREVAVKAIHPDLANRPDFVRRFEREAQIVARLEHPHVVPLYDYWRDPSGAYLVMRFLRGGTLEALVGRRGLDASHAATILDQVASALDAAHRQGVIHRDVKPGNVLLDEEGNAYLSDFGIAVEAGAPEPSRVTMRGTPAYLSPEQIRSEPATARSDVYSLGVLLYHVLVGEPPVTGASLEERLERHLRHPVPSVAPVRPELPATVDGVIARATAKDPDRRFARAGELAEAFRVAIESSETAAVIDGGVRNPYKGLRSFLEADAGDFFGREPLVRRLVERVAERGSRSRFLCVVGPSGSGKSSVVRAGLLPALRAGAIPGSDRWFYVDLAPGADLLRELGSALLGVAVRPPPSLLDDLARDELGLVRAAERILPDPEAELFIVIDQLEELFTLAEEEDRARALDIVRAAAETPGSRVRVVATLRADFFDQPLSVPGFGDLLAERTEAIPPMSAEQLERAVAAPAERAGLTIEPGLVARIVADVADRPGALPLLQYALTELVERRSGDSITVDAYERIGGVSGAVARRAEQLFSPLGDAGREACRQLFLRLVAIGDAVEVTRRRVRRFELLSLADREVMDAVIETFGRHRLLSFDRDPATREPTVEIAHEAILGAWDRLHGWIESSRAELRVHGRIAAAAGEWSRGGRNVDDLLTGVRLAEAEDLTTAGSVGLTDAEREFVEAGLARRRAEVETERVRGERERRLEHRAMTRLRALVAVLAAAMVVASGLTAVAVNRSRDAERERDRARVAGLAGAAVSSLPVDPELGLTLALHAVHLGAALDERVPAEAVEALHWAMQEAVVEYPVRDGPEAVVPGPDGPRGVLDLPLAELVRAAEGGPTRPLTPAECRRFFATTTCPTLPTALPEGVAAEPIGRLERPAAQPLAGTKVTILWQSVHQDLGLLEPLRRELDSFTARTGIEVEIVDFPELETWIAGDDIEGDPPDLAFSIPGPVADLARQGHPVDLSAFLDVEQLRQDQSPYLVSLGTVDEDGSWPSNDGGLYGAFVSLDVKSLVWYAAPELQRAGHALPATLPDLLALGDRLRSEGHTPWCIGQESGDASGWPGTDWVENFMLAEAGPDAYDRWTFHQTPFDSPDVRRAFERFGEIVFTPGSVLGGPPGVNATSFAVAQRPILRDPPKCWLSLQASFTEAFLPEGSVGDQTDVFGFPSAAGLPQTLIGGGEMVVSFADRPEVRELLRYFVDAGFGAEMAAGGGFLRASRTFPLEDYPPFTRRLAELARDALAADGFRFDASDLMPGEIGADLFWTAMTTYVAEGPESLDRILDELDAAWPD
ncbi:MAG: extracellular solute-binding protein [Actinomycetota bacterium]